METAKIKSIFKLFDTDVDYGYITTFQAELNRLCSLILIPAIVVAILSWLPYIPLDWKLKLPSLRRYFIIALRLGFTLTGIILLFLHFTHFFKVKSYWLLFSLICYLQLASAAIVGLVEADAAYMGGYAMLILVIPLMPFKTTHSITMMSSALILFVIFGIIADIGFYSGDKNYGLLNLIVAFTASIIGIFVMNNIRKVSYERNHLNYLNNMRLKVATTEIFLINEELKKANTLKSKLLEIAAHDLKTPLQKIMGCAQFLQDEVKEDPASEKKLNAICKSTDNMIKLINKLLKSLSIESGKLKIKKSIVDLEKLAESVIEANKPYLNKKNQKIFFSAEGKCIVTADIMLLQEVFENLLSNAIKFSFPGQSIWVNISQHGSIVSLKVRDEGPGLNKDDKEKLFNRFQKLSAKPTGGESSTGLGLAITKDLVELFNGKIRVESEPDLGSTFIVDFPKARV